LLATVNSLLEHVCKLGLEGIVSKRADAAYRSGRSSDWIKTKCPAWKEANEDRFEKMEGAKPRRA
jgi:bifunctional non-homologous end joining protein LigD